MGTRGSYGFILNEKVYSTYNHSDSYPEGLGSDVCIEISKINDLCDLTKVDQWKILKDKVANIKVVSESTDKPTKENIEKYKDLYADLTVSTRSLDEWYCLLRKAQDVSTYMDGLLSGKIIHLLDSNDFIKDSLYCEYGYLINLDEMVLECYEGFKKEPQTGNRFGEKPNNNGYYPCALVGKLPLKNIFDDEELLKLYIKE